MTTDSHSGMPSWLSKVPFLSQLHPTPRVMLFFMALVVQIVASTLSGIGFVLNHPAFNISGTTVWVVWFVPLFMIAVPATDRILQKYMDRLKRAALIVFVFLFLLGIGEAVFVLTDAPIKDLSPLTTTFDSLFGYNDGTALSHQGAENLIKGRNPYAEANIVKGLREFNYNYEKTTPLRAGQLADVFPYPTPQQLEKVWLEAVKNPDAIPPEIESSISYPAGSFLLPAPFLRAGLKDFRLIYLIYILPAIFYVIRRAPRNTKLIFAGAFLVSLVIHNSVAMGETGSLVFPFMLLAWVLPRRNLWMSALFMGLAVATKQVAWFLLPFYLIYIFRTMDLRRAIQVLTVVAAIFIAMNAPFIASDPYIWWASVMAPMRAPVFPLGIGIISLVTSGVLDIRSPFIFGVLEFTVMVLAVVWYFRNCQRYPHTGPILAVLPLFFAWRSLWPYFYYIDFIVLAAIIMDKHVLVSGATGLERVAKAVNTGEE